MAKKSGSKEILALVKEFLLLNEARTRRDLKENEVERWYELKETIESQLFSRPPTKKPEQRKHLRVGAVTLPVHFVHGGDECEGVAREVSDGGLFVSTPDPLPVGAQLDIEIDLDHPTFGGGDWKLPVRVIYNNPGHSFTDRAFRGMGLAVQPGHPEVARKWRQLVAHLLETAAESGPPGGGLA